MAEIDERLHAAWEELGIKPTLRLSDPEFAQKIYETLVGESLSGDQLVAFTQQSNALQNGRLQGLVWAQAVTQSQPFAAHWADVLTRQWLWKGSLPFDSEPAKALATSLEKRLASSVGWNQVATSLLGGEIVGDNLDDPSEIFLAALAGNGNHQLMKRIGTNFLNENLDCVRCHDSPSVAGSETISQQADYWALAAMLKGVNARGNGYRGTRSIIDEQPEIVASGQAPTLYYELVDGRVTVAEASLPGGRDWREAGSLPRVAFAKWLTSTRAFDRAMVNQTWKLVFGGYLAPQVPGLDETGLEARSQLLGFLSDQFRAHDHDLKQLVAWIASSDAFSRRPVELTSSQWLVASDEELNALQTADRLFALGSPSNKYNGFMTLENSLAELMRWSAPKGGIDNDRGASEGEVLLAQPDASAAESSGKRRRTNAANNKDKTPSLRYMLHAERHSPAEREFVLSLINSPQLSWEQQVQHIVALSEGDKENGKIRSLADELLQTNGGNAEEALLKLLWSVNNANAG